MKNTLILPLFLMLGCSSSRIQARDFMQPDGSYQIRVGGNSFTSRDAVREEAYRRAGLLCPSGYTTRSEVPGVSMRANTVLIVKCKE